MAGKIWVTWLYSSVGSLHYIVGDYIQYYFVSPSTGQLIYSIFADMYPYLDLYLRLVNRSYAHTEKPGNHFRYFIGYIALTLFYIGDKFYYLFDYMVYNLPLVKSTIVGFSNWAMLINHRMIYIPFVWDLSVFQFFLFRRLPIQKWSLQMVVFIGIPGRCRIMGFLYSCCEHSACRKDATTLYRGE